MTQDRRPDILVIEDTPANLKFIREVLYNNNYQVRVAPNGPLGLQAAQLVHPDLILLDIMMPGMNGYEVCEKLKADPATRDIPIIFLSALDETWDKVKAFEAGGIDYITKPFEAIELLQRVKAQVQLYFAQQRVIELNDELSQHIATLNRYVPSIRVDAKGIITHASRAYHKLCGYEKEELIGKPINILEAPDESGPSHQKIKKELKQQLCWEGEIKLRKKDGSHYWVLANTTPLYGEEGEIIGCTSIQKDITNQKQVEQLSITDALTGLYNRRKFNCDLPDELNRARRDHKHLALLMLDVDHFKAYNDNHGHLEGDRVLEAIGQSLKQTFLRAGDHSFRLGGEEFGVILSSGKLQDFPIMAERIRANIEALGIPHAHNSAAKVITLSIGMVLVEEGSDISSDEAYRLADRTLYQAKHLGRNQVVSIDANQDQPDSVTLNV